MTLAVARRPDRSALVRWFFAGGAWGLTLAAYFFAVNTPSCGLPCPSDVAVTTGICMATGWLTIGPFAAFAGRRSRPGPQ
ncbi:MAG: hypothetical protein P8Y71_00885 [Pseudolabrys sp.]